MRSIYNKAFLERKASRDGVDKALRVSSPLSWIGLAAVAVMLLTLIGWAFLDEVPVIVTAPGYLIAPSAASLTVTAPSGGQVTGLALSLGQKVEAGQEVLRIRQGDEMFPVFSGMEGVVRELSVSDGDQVNPRDDLLRLSPVPGESMSGQWVLVTFVSGADAVQIHSKLKENQPVMVHMSLSAAGSDSCGEVEGLVIGVDEYVTSRPALEHMFGAQSPLSEQLWRENGALYAVVCSLREDISSSNGLLWSNREGSLLHILPGTGYSARLILNNEHPIDLVFRGASEEAR